MEEAIAPCLHSMETDSREKTILDRIVEARRESIAHRKRVLPDVRAEDGGREGSAAARFRGRSHAGWRTT